MEDKAPSSTPLNDLLAKIDAARAEVATLKKSKDEAVHAHNRADTRLSNLLNEYEKASVQYVGRPILYQTVVTR